MKFERDLQSRPTRMSRVGELDALRALACGAVVAWHVLLYVAVDAAGPTRAAWHAAAQCFVLGGPVFFFLSALLCFHRHPEGEPLRGYWGRRLLLVGVPYFVWTLVYLLLDLPAYRDMTPVQGAQAVGMSLLLGVRHLGFLNALIQFYLLFPLLRWAWNRADRGALAAAGLLLGFGWLEGAPRLLPHDLPPAVFSAHAGFLPAWMPYVVLGAWAAPHIDRLGRLVPRPAGLWFACLAIASIGAVVVASRSGVAGSYAGSARWEVALAAMLWLPLLLRWSFHQRGATRSMWRELARHTPAVFFAHLLPLALAAVAVPAGWHPAVRLPLLLLATAAGTGLLIRLLKRNATTMLTLGLLHRPPKPRPATIWTEASEPPVADEIRNWRDEEPVPLTLSRR